MGDEIREWSDVEAEVRRRWHSLSAFRLGLIVGEMELALKPPAGKSSNWLRLFRNGIATAEDRRREILRAQSRENA